MQARDSASYLPSYLSSIRSHRQYLSFKVIAVETATIKRPVEEIVMRLHDVEEVSTIASEKSEMVQLADVIAGAVNRKTNYAGNRGFKDDMANMIIQDLDIQLAEQDLPDVDATTWIYL